MMIASENSALGIGLVLPWDLSSGYDEQMVMGAWGKARTGSN